LHLCAPTVVPVRQTCHPGEPVLASIHRDSRKYERTRLRSEPAFPTYNTAPAASLNRYTPALSGSAAAFSRGSINQYSGDGVRVPISVQLPSYESESDSGETQESGKRCHEDRSFIGCWQPQESSCFCRGGRSVLRTRRQNRHRSPPIHPHLRNRTRRKSQTPQRRTLPTNPSMIHCGPKRTSKWASIT